MIPAWLYENRRYEFGLRVRRFGSRYPLRLVLTICSGGTLPPSYLFAIGKLGLQFGPEDGVVEGHAGMPSGSRYKTWFLPRGFAVGVSWDGAA